MSQKFLTLDGPGEPRRPRSMLESLMSLGAVTLTPAQASARRAAAIASHASRTEAAEEQQYREHTSGTASKMADREELWKPAEYDLTDKAPSLFAHYGIEGLADYKEEDLGELALLGLVSNGLVLSQPLGSEDLHNLGRLASYALMSCTPDEPLDEGLSFSWKSVTRMFTPPQSIRKSFSQAFKAVNKGVVAKITRPFAKFAIPKSFKTKFSNLGRKSIRMIGAINTLPLTLVSGKMRNQMFGLKGKEMRVFDAAAKAGRMVAVAAVSVVGAPAISGVMSKAGASGLSKYMATAGGKSFLGQGAAGKLGSFIIKDAVKGQLVRVVQDSSGKLLGNVFKKNQVPADVYNDLPDNEPVPTLVSQGDVQQPAYVGGTGAMNPSGGMSDPQQYGESQPFPEAARQQSMGDIAETRLDPDDRMSMLNPAQAESYRAVEEEGETPLKDLIAQHRQAQTLPQGELETSGGEPSLGSIIRESRRRKFMQNRSKKKSKTRLF